MKDGIEVRKNGVRIVKVGGCYAVEGSRNGPWDYLRNARADADNLVLASYIFTFGSNHRTRADCSLENNYVTIRAQNEEVARKMMRAERSAYWAFCYQSKELAGVERFGLKELSLSEVSLKEV